MLEGKFLLNSPIAGVSPLLGSVFSLLVIWTKFVQLHSPALALVHTLQTKFQKDFPTWTAMCPQWPTWIIKKNTLSSYPHTQCYQNFTAYNLWIWPWRSEGPITLLTTLVLFPLCSRDFLILFILNAICVTMTGTFHIHSPVFFEISIHMSNVFFFHLLPKLPSLILLKIVNTAPPADKCSVRWSCQILLFYVILWLKPPTPFSVNLIKQHLEVGRIYFTYRL